MNQDFFELTKEGIDALSATDRGSLIVGIRRAIDHNKQIIAMWREYGKLARTLRREYRGDEGRLKPAMLANWITASSLSENELEALNEIQFDLETRLNYLVGQESLI